MMWQCSWFLHLHFRAMNSTVIIFTLVQVLFDDLRQHGILATGTFRKVPIWYPGIALMQMVNEQQWKFQGLSPLKIYGWCRQV